MTPAHAALRVVCNLRETEEMTDLRTENARLLAVVEEARHACPTLLASPGDMFEHRLDEPPTSFQPETFEYIGRTTASGKPPQHVTQAGWLIFKYVAGYGIEGGYHANNGGVRDVIGAWPARNYRVYDAEGHYEKGVFCLPPSKCYCLRKVEYSEFEEAIESEEDEEGEESEGEESEGRDEDVGDEL